MGWLGWTEEQTLHADMNAIVLAYEGKVDMLKAIHGDTDKEKGTQKRKPSPDDFRDFAADHNAMFRAQRARANPKLRKKR